MTIPELFAPTLTGRRDDPALDCDVPEGGRITLTFGELAGRANRLARFLTSLDVKAGDRLAFFLPNRVEIVDLWLACTQLGVIVVPINVLYRARELAHIIGDAKPVAVITTMHLAVRLPSGTQWWDADGLDGQAARFPATPVQSGVRDDTPAALVYTSGTTGASKGAVLTHRNFVANARSLVGAWRITRDDRYLAVLPLFHVHGLGNGIHSWIATGCHMRLVERFEHERAADLFDEYQPTLFFGVPTIYVRLLDVPAVRARAIGARARLFVSGSAPLPAQVLADFRARFGHVILERYGMTETLMNAGNPYDGERRPGTVGHAFPHVEIRIVTEGDRATGDGETGELLVRGANVCDGYWKNRDATAAAFTGGWFRTGDIGRRSADGYITLEGRRSDLIISGGFNIYPREIEELLLEFPGVREAAVAGVPDQVRGEVPVAYLVTDGALDEAALDSRLRSQVASFKIPRRYVRVESLPRTALGKVQKHLLPPYRDS